MRKIFMSLLAALAIVAGGFMAATPASANDLPPDAAGWKFWSPDICIDGSAINGSAYRVAYIAQQWNLKTTILALNYEDDCAAAGYSASRRMVVGTYSSTTDGNCVVYTNTEVDITNGMRRWTNGPGAYINAGNAACVGTQELRDHWISFAIGSRLGLSKLNSTAWNSRVMNMTAYSVYNIPLPDQNSANTLSAIYAYAYCQPFGTTC